MVSASKFLESALGYHSAGDLDKAERAYKKFLCKAPKHPEGLQGLGLIAHQRGNNKRAVKLITGAIERSPEIPLFYINLGIVLVAKGDPDHAIETLLIAAGKFQQTNKFKSELFEIHSHLGELYLGADRLASALKHFKEAVQLQPDNAIIYKNLGDIQIELGDLDSGVNYLKRAIQIQPDFGEAYNKLGHLFHNTGDLRKARECYQQAIQVQPKLPQSYCNLGNLLLEVGAVKPAIDCLHKALQIKPDYAEAYLNLGIAMLDQQDFNGARDRFRRACQLKRNNIGMRGYWSHALLSRGYFSEGWAESEWLVNTGTRVVSDVPAPFWDGSSLMGRTVLVLSEQGVGDQIMFLSCLPDLLDKAKPNACIVECDLRLVPLYQRSFQSVHFQAKQQDVQWLANQPDVDVKIAISSLPRLFRSRREDFPCRVGYLIPDSERVLRWKKRYQALGAKRVIGVSWRGGYLERDRRKRSTTLAQWLPILSIPDTAFVNLQYGDCRQELEAANAEGNVFLHDWPDSDPLTDLDDFAAKIAALDLVISIDNCTVHMAGAVGSPVWTLLPFVSDWRWMRHREDTLWYPTMKLFRQLSPGDWDAVLQNVAEALAAF